MKKGVAVVFLLLAALGCAFAQGTTDSAASAERDGLVIALSNSFYGNSWRKQSVDCFIKSAEEAKAAGRIADYIVVNGDGSQNTQIAQLNSLILSGVDAICINAASPTALNGTIDTAIKQGIKVITFDSVVTHPEAYKFGFDFYGFGTTVAEYIAQRLNGEGNVINVRGIRGSDPEIQMNNGIIDTFAKYPGIKIVAEVDGEADAATCQSAIANVLPSLDEVDAVVTQGGEYGAVQAFEAAGREIPLVVGYNRAEFIDWWIKAKAESGYETISVGSEPSISSFAFWAALHILEGDEVPLELNLPAVAVTNETVDLYADMEPGTVVAQDYNEEFTMNILAEL